MTSDVRLELALLAWRYGARLLVLLKLRELCVLSDITYHTLSALPALWTVFLDIIRTLSGRDKTAYEQKS